MAVPVAPLTLALDGCMVGVEHGPGPDGTPHHTIVFQHASGVLRVVVTLNDEQMRMLVKNLSGGIVIANVKGFAPPPS